MCNTEKFHPVYTSWLNDISYVNHNLLVNPTFVSHLINKALDQ